MSERNELVEQALAGAGFDVVMREPLIPGTRSRRIDLLAWASDPMGDLVPWAVVELKSGSKIPPHPASVLERFAPARDLLGTRDHYLVVDGVDWYKADAGLQKLEQVDGPTSPPHGGQGRMNDTDMLTSLLQDRLWRAADKARGTMLPRDLIRLVPDVIGPGSQPATLSGAEVPIDDRALWTSGRRASESFLERSAEGFAEWGSHHTVSMAVARLAGSKLNGTVVDPFCGLGTYLWNSIDHAVGHGTGLREAVGVELNQVTAETTRSLAATAPIPVTIINGDGYGVNLPLSECVVAAPPLGMRLQEKPHLLDGTTTNDGELAAIDRCVRLLKPGGRAVLHLSRGFTFKSNGEGYREYLATHLRVAALIGLPSGALTGTRIPSVLLVLEAAEPSLTFIAQLGEDWEDQLASNGAALQAALEHLDGAPR